MNGQLINFGDGTGACVAQSLGVLKDGTPKGATQVMLQVIEYLKARMSTTERGAAAVEYGMLVALIAAVIVTIVAFLGGQVNDAFKAVSDGIAGK